jgi:hypothetical protein
MIDHTAVTREVRSLISRRRELLTFLGTVFAALGIFLGNALQGNLPAPLQSVSPHVFEVYAFLLMVPSLILAMRLAKLNAGMTLNGVLYQRLMAEQDFTRKATLETRKRAASVNPFGVNFLMFLLSTLLAAFSAGLLALGLSFEEHFDAPAPWIAVGVGALVVVVWLLMYLRYHNRAAAFALAKAEREPVAPFTRQQWEEHTAGSMEDGNHDMITILALVGLIIFSAFEALSGLGKVQAGSPGITPQDVQNYGPVAYGLLMVVTCLLGMVTYIRLRVAIGNRSLELDPTDRPFRPLKLTDSVLGYALLVFLFVVSLHFLLTAIYKDVTGNDLDALGWGVLLAINGVVFVLGILVEQVTLVIAGRRKQPEYEPAAG